jgi:tripartite-type tricarboxylate transporter receptor subunit TctC
MRNVGVRRGGCLLALGMLGFESTAQADAIGDFYRGKTMTMIVSAGPGNGVDTNGRLVGHFMMNHIPGKPTLIVKNMPGAGHVLAANYVYNEAPRDGTIMLTTLGNIIPYQLLDGRGVRYDASKFHWLGSSEFSNSMIFTWHTSDVTTLEQAKTKEVTMGATGAGSTTYVYPVLMNKLFGTKFKLVSGYKSDNEINIAMERGEVQGRAGVFYTGMMALHPDWMVDHKVHLLAQIGLEPQPEIPQVPLLLDFAKTEEARQIVRLYVTVVTVGRPFLTTPGTPADRVAALRKAFDETMRDPAFLKDAGDKGIEMNPSEGEKIQKVVEQYVATPAAIVEKAKALIAQ